MEQGTKVEVGTQVEKGQNFAEWIKQLKKTPEEVKAETQSDSFKQFLDKVTRPMERALDTAVYGDFLQDLLMSSDRNNSNQDSTSGRNQNLWHAMSLSSQESKGNFNAAGEDKIKTPTIDQTAKSYLSQRCITQIQPYTGESDEYVLAAYRHSLPSISQTPQTYQFSAERLESLSKQVGGYIPGGVAAIWNLKAPSVPERLWHCSSEITCILRHPGNRGCVIGGLKNGQIVRWDTSADGVPVESSALLQEKGHFSAIYGMHMTGLDSSSATLVTIGEDGFLCSWSPNHLIEPIMQTELLFRPTEKDIKLGKQFADSVVGHVMGHVLYETDYDVSPGAISFPREDSGTVYIGGEDGCIYVGTISNRAVQLTTRLLGHTSPVRIIRHHPGIVGEDNISADSKTASDTFISAGFEWKVNIWSPKVRYMKIFSSMLKGKKRKLGVIFMVTNYSYLRALSLLGSSPTDPLLTSSGMFMIVQEFQINDSLFIVSSNYRCPHNPSIFAVGDGSGRIHLFDVFREDFVRGQPNFTSRLFLLCDTGFAVYVLQSPFVTEVVSNYGITTIQWSQKRRQIYVGDSSGELSIWNVRPDVRFFLEKTVILVPIISSLHFYSLSCSQRLRSRHDVQPSLSSLMDFLQSRAKQQSTSTAEIATL